MTSGKIPFSQGVCFQLIVNSPITTSFPQNTAPGLNRYSIVPLKYFMLEHGPVHGKVVGLITGQSTYLDCRFNP